jgi:mannose-6-phosphate isomerase-like protein (cupin superfamily)
VSDTVWVKNISSNDLEARPGLGGRWRRFISPDKANAGLIVAMGELQPGEAMGWHAHPEPEVFFVIEGHGEAVWREGNEEHTAEMRPGTAFFKIGGIAHNMINRGKVTLRGLGIKVGSV